MNLSCEGCKLDFGEPYCPQCIRCKRFPYVRPDNFEPKEPKQCEHDFICRKCQEPQNLFDEPMPSIGREKPSLPEKIDV